MIGLTPKGALRATCHLEGVTVSPGDAIVSETLLVNWGLHGEELLQHYASQVATTMVARLTPKPMTGWCSWYRYYSDVCEDDVVKNVQYLQTNGFADEIEIVQLDSGYETAVGDWLSVNRKFPHGLSWLARQIREAGFRPGLWLAPFAVSPDSELYRQHPDWVVHEESGAPLQTWKDFDWDVQLFGLDCTHPEVLDWLGIVFETVVHEWGFDYLKLDFLFCGALRGRRYDPGSTSIQAYRQGLSLIREAAKDCYVLGCGAPLLPSVGLVDAMRIGCDIATFWEPSPADMYQVWPAAKNAVRNTLSRYWMHGHLWQNDPDCLIVGNVNNQLTDAEVQTWATLVGLSGGLVILGDALPELGPEQVRLIDQVLPPYGQAAVPDGMLSDGLPTTLVLCVKRSFETWHIVGLFNWEAEERTAEFDLRTLPIDGAQHVYEFWTQEHLGLVADRATFTLPAHGCCLLSVRPALDRPQLAGSTFHYTQGGVELLGQKWDGTILSLRLGASRNQQGRLVVVWPEPYQLGQIGGQAIVIGSDVGKNQLTLELALASESLLEISFRLKGEHS
jgi:alpha-galactosidase